MEENLNNSIIKVVCYPKNGQYLKMIQIIHGKRESIWQRKDL